MDDTTTGQGPATETAAETAAEAKTIEAEFTSVMEGGDWPVAAAPAAPPPIEHTPTREEAREMFKANPGLWAVLTDTGNMTRDEC